MHKLLMRLYIEFWFLLNFGGCFGFVFVYALCFRSFFGGLQVCCFLFLIVFWVSSKGNTIFLLRKMRILKGS